MSKFSLVEIRFNAFNSFRRAIILLLLATVFHFIAIRLGKSWPLTIIYPTVLVYAYWAYKRVGVNLLAAFVCLLPSLMLFFLYIYISLFFNGDMIMYRYYYIAYYSITILSLFLSAIYILFHLETRQDLNRRIDMMLLQQLCVIQIVIGFFVSVLLANLLYPPLYFDIKLNIIIYSLMGLSVSIEGYYIYSTRCTKQKRQYDVVDLQPCVKNPKLPIPILEKYDVILRSNIESKKLFLKHNLSMEILSRETGIPRHHISEFFSQYLQTSFYNYIAEYRINYALKYMENNLNTLTLEGLTDECGFNSKTTFNKYFKEFTGFSLSEYKDEYYSLA